MRRLLVTVAIAAALLVGSGCSRERDGGAGSASPDATPSAGSPSAGSSGPDGGNAGPTPPPGAVTGTAGGNATEVCAAAIKASTDSVQTYVEELGKMVRASGAGDTAAAQAAQGKAEAALRAWGTALKEQSASATDARLKAVLTEIGAEVGSMKASIESVDESKLDQLQQRLDQLCGS